MKKNIDYDSKMERLNCLIDCFNSHMHSIQLLTSCVQKPLEINDRGLRESTNRFSEKLDKFIEIFRNPSELVDIFKNLKIDLGEFPELINEIYKIFSKPLQIDYRDLLLHVNSLQDCVKELNSTLNHQILGEIKFIGEKLHKIDQRLSKMESIQSKEIGLSFTVDGYELVKKSINYQKDDLIEDPNQDLRKLLGTLDENESSIIIRRFGLFGEKKQTLASIGKSISLSRQRVSQIELKALRKMRHPSRRILVDKIKSKLLRECILGKEN